MDLPLEKEARARLLELLETRKAACAWRCPNRACDGKPHDYYNYKHARGKQQPPWGPGGHGGNFSDIYHQGGRGSGKTWCGAAALAEIILFNSGYDEQGSQRAYAVVGPILSTTKTTLMEGESGLIKALGGEQGPHIKAYNRSTGIIHMNNGAIVYSGGADNRGAQIESKNISAIWCDEVGLWNLNTWEYTWDNAISFAVRKGEALFIVTGTPKQGHPLVERLIKSKNVYRVVHTTYENRDNLSPKKLAEWEERWDKTRTGRQELHGEFLTDTPGALWTSASLDITRHEFPPAVDEMLNIVVGWDPAVTSTDKSDEHGIIVAARLKGEPAHFVILDDRSGVYSPDGAVSMVLDAYETWSADSIVVEVNQGGDFAESLLKTRTPTRTIDIKKVRASRGKRVRAEPIAALSEQGRLHMVGYFVPLEEQMTTWTPDKPGSPDRLDAMVWAITALLEKSTNTGAYYYGRRNQRPSGGQ